MKLAVRVTCEEGVPIEEGAVIRLSIVRIVNAPSLSQIVAEVKVLEGDIDAIDGPLRSPDVDGQWRIGRSFYQPIDPTNKAVNRNPRPVILCGPKVLAAGMWLTDEEA